jgi:hypothetical protein
VCAVEGALKGLSGMLWLWFNMLVKGGSDFNFLTKERGRTQDN